MKINKFLTISISVLFIVYFGIKLIDTIYKNSIYSNLDYLQTLINTNHETRYQIFILGLAIILIITNLTFLKIKIDNTSLKILLLTILNLVSFNVIFLVLQINNVSIVLISFLSIILSCTSIYFNKR